VFGRENFVTPHLKVVSASSNSVDPRQFGPLAELNFRVRCAFDGDSMQALEVAFQNQPPSQVIILMHVRI
jgi:hypothetical protein